MDVRKASRTVSTGGILAALAVLFHSAPVFLPGLGMIISPLSTLPVALAAICSAYTGTIVYISSALILFFISPQEAMIFIAATGLLGLVSGMCHEKRKPASILISSLALFAGIISLKYIADLAVFGNLTPNASFIKEITVFGLFSLFYAGIWVFIIKFIKGFLKKIIRDPA